MPLLVSLKTIGVWLVFVACPPKTIRGLVFNPLWASIEDPARPCSLPPLHSSRVHQNKLPKTAHPTSFNSDEKHETFEHLGGQRLVHKHLCKIQLPIPALVQSQVPMKTYPRTQIESQGRPFRHKKTSPFRGTTNFFHILGITKQNHDSRSNFVFWGSEVYWDMLPRISQKKWMISWCKNCGGSRKPYVSITCCLFSNKMC